MSFPKKPRRLTPGMVLLDDKLVSAELNDEFFVCDLVRCKGACCVEGDVGAPLEKSELALLDEVYTKVKPFLEEKGIRAIEEQGTYVYDLTGDYSTPLVNGRECAYAVFDPNGIALCGIEKAFFAGEISWRKPVSCHLYPIRIRKMAGLEALNYDQWDICSPACAQGTSLGVRVYEFLKEAIIRKYGADFYKELDAVMTQRRAEEAENPA